MKTKIICESSAIRLNQEIEKLIADGWEPVGSHSVVVIHSQLRYSGAQHMDTLHEAEYSITMQKNT